jgi:ABC-type multidrug transport system ATPase subunit
MPDLLRSGCRVGSAILSRVVSREIVSHRPSKVAVRIDALTKTFPVRRTWVEMLRHPLRTTSNTAVDNVSCDIFSGELFGLLGPNGAGKTTLFKMLTASTTPDAGIATVLGYDAVTEAKEVRRVVSCVYASERNLNWRLSARENLRLWASLNRIYGVAARARIEEVLATVEIADTGEKIVAMFSSGMRQRLLIARALLSKPKLLLLDEPTRSLDPISARSFRQLLRQITGESDGCTVVLATHNSEEAMELCDRVAILDHGRLLALGSGAELSQRFGDQIYCLWTRNPDHPAILMLDAEGRARLIDVLPPERDGWYCVRLAILGGMSHSTEILGCLTASGVDVARFEQRNISLAELIERVVKSSGEPHRA